MTQRRQSDRSQVRIAPIAAESDRAFDQAGGPAQFSPDPIEMREIQTCPDEAERVIERFRNSDGFVSLNVSLAEHSALGEGARQEGAG